MPQMKPLNWLIIFSAIIFSMATLISFIYFIVCPTILCMPLLSPISKPSWKWKW